MAVLSASQLREIREEAALYAGTAIVTTTDDFNTAIQNLEDYWEGALTVTPSLSINLSIVVGLTGSLATVEADAIKAAWLRHRATRDRQALE